jgi:hypothetical protein
VGINVARTLLRSVHAHRRVWDHRLVVGISRLDRAIDLLFRPRESACDFIDDLIAMQAEASITNARSASILGASLAT